MREKLPTNTYPRFVLIYEKKGGELGQFISTGKIRFLHYLQALKAKRAFFRVVYGPRENWYNESIDFVLPRDHEKLLEAWRIFSAKTELV